MCGFESKCEYIDDVRWPPLMICVCLVVVENAQLLALAKCCIAHAQMESDDPVDGVKDDERL